MGVLGTLSGAALVKPAIAAGASDPAPPLPEVATVALEPIDQLRAALRARLGDDIFSSWFNALELERVEGGTVTISVPVRFLRNWIASHYAEDLQACCAGVFGTGSVEVVLRDPFVLTEARRRENTEDLNRYGGALTKAQRRKLLREANRRPYRGA